MTAALWRATVAMSLGGLLFGVDTAVISGVTDDIRGLWSLSPAQLGAAVSAALWGTLAGAVLSGIPGDRFGSMSVLRWVGLTYLVSAIGSALSTGPASFVAARLLGGLAIGASSVLVPIYLAEISPAERRGRLVGLFQFAIVLGILIAYLSNFLIGRLITDAVAWRVKLGSTAVPALLFFALTLRLPHSPAWLAGRGRVSEAQAAAGRLGLAALPQVHGRGDASATVSWRRHRRPILLAIGLALLNQLSGINAILYYLNDIFAAAGFGRLSADGQAVAVGSANLAGTFLGLALIDRWGRRPLLLVGGLGTAAALAGVALVFAGALPTALLLPLLILFILAFAGSQGAVIWVYLSEIFPADVRARGQAIGSGTHWAANAVISLVFPLLAGWSRSGPFWAFAVAMLMQALLAWRVFPETRQRGLDHMAASLSPARTGHEQHERG